MFHRDPTERKEPQYCPVCKALLGTRYFEDPLWAHCDECKATYYYRSHQRKPKAILDIHNKKGVCDCGRCGR